MIRSCNAAGLPLRFFVQVTTREMAARLGKGFDDLRATNNVELQFGDMSADDYMARLRMSDTVLIPYSPQHYAVKASGVFAEAVAMGKVTVVSPGGWMAGELHAGRGAGTVFKSFDAGAMVAAIGEAVERFSTLDADAQARASAWRELHSMARYLDRLLAELPA